LFSYFWFFVTEVYNHESAGLRWVSAIIRLQAARPFVGLSRLVVRHRAIAVLFVVWAPHMFTWHPADGELFSWYCHVLHCRAQPGSSLSNWVSTMFRGSLDLRSAHCCSRWPSLILFPSAASSGLMRQSPRRTSSITINYFVVAHFHYCLVAVRIFGIFARHLNTVASGTGTCTDESTGQGRFLDWRSWGMNLGVNLPDALYRAGRHCRGRIPELPT